MTTDDDDRKHDEIVAELHRLARSITPEALPGRDAADGHVESLTEAVMGITSGLFEIARSIDGLADAVRESIEESKDV
jgi:hypothetical protein